MGEPIIWNCGNVAGLRLITGSANLPDVAMTWKCRGKIVLKWVVTVCPYLECTAGLVLAIFGGIGLFAKSDPRLAWASLICGTVIFFCRLTKVISDQAKERNAKSPEPIDIALETIRLQLDGKDAGLRLCVHVLEGEELRQLTEYVGCSSRKKCSGRRFSIHCGIAGDALRNERAAFSFLPEGRDFVDFLVQEFAYSKEKAQKLSQSQVAWGAVPIGEPPDCIGVLFVDSTQRDFFSGKAGTKRKKVLSTSISGIAAWLLTRYKN